MGRLETSTTLGLEWKQNYSAKMDYWKMKKQLLQMTVIISKMKQTKI